MGFPKDWNVNTKEVDRKVKVDTWSAKEQEELERLLKKKEEAYQDARELLVVIFHTALPDTLTNDTANAVALQLIENRAKVKYLVKKLGPFVDYNQKESESYDATVEYNRGVEAAIAQASQWHQDYENFDILIEDLRKIKR